MLSLAENFRMSLSLKVRKNTKKTMPAMWKVSRSPSSTKKGIHVRQSKGLNLSLYRSREMEKRKVQWSNEDTRSSVLVHEWENYIRCLHSLSLTHRYLGKLSERQGLVFLCCYYLSAMEKTDWLQFYLVVLLLTQHLIYSDNDVTEREGGSGAERLTHCIVFFRSYCRFQRCYLLFKKQSNETKTEK